MEKFVSTWLSYVVFRTLPDETKKIFRNFQKTRKKYVSVDLHRKFNEICLKEDLLPIYTDI